MSSLLEVRGLSTVFQLPDGDVQVVRGIDFGIDRSETLAIVGESGCGKSIAMQSLVRLVPPPGAVQAGEAMFDGENLLGLDSAALSDIRGRRIGMIFQDPMSSLNPVLTIGAQLAESLQRHQGLSRDAALARAVEVLAMVGIPNPAGRIADYPHQFSGGQRQRIMIAIAICCEPDLLIADEPTTALDVTVQAQIVALVADLQERLGMAVIWITHDLTLAGNMADRVAVMYAGSIVESGPVHDVFDRPQHPYTRGLLASIPAFDGSRQSRLPSITGTPARLAGLPAGCAFAPRCEFAFERCTQQAPAMTARRNGHLAACWREES